MNINLPTLINVTINQLLKVVIIVIINHFNHEIVSCYVIMMCYPQSTLNQTLLLSSSKISQEFYENCEDI